MKKSLFKLLIIFFLCFGLPQILRAQTGYVSDMIYLTFRDGPGENYAVSKRLKSDTPLSILGEQGEYYKVELESKEVGWVDKRFISFETPKIVVIETLKQEKKILEDKVQDLERQINAIKTQISADDNASIQKVLENENKDLQKKNEDLSAELADFKSKNTGFLNADMIKWSLFGVGVLMMGWIFGHSVSVNKRKGGSSLLR
jgi:SH3 domain protein